MADSREVGEQSESSSSAPSMMDAAKKGNSEDVGAELALANGLDGDLSDCQKPGKVSHSVDAPALSDSMDVQATSDTNGVDSQATSDSMDSQATFDTNGVDSQATSDTNGVDVQATSNTAEAPVENGLDKTPSLETEKEEEIGRLINGYTESSEVSQPPSPAPNSMAVEVSTGELVPPTLVSACGRGASAPPSDSQSELPSPGSASGGANKALGEKREAAGEVLPVKKLGTENCEDRDSHTSGTVGNPTEIHELAADIEVSTARDKHSDKVDTCKAADKKDSPKVEGLHVEVDAGNGGKVKGEEKEGMEVDAGNGGKVKGEEKEGMEVDAGNGGKVKGEEKEGMEVDAGGMNGEKSVSKEADTARAEGPGKAGEAEKLREVTPGQVKSPEPSGDSGLDASTGESTTASVSTPSPDLKTPPPPQKTPSVGSDPPGKSVAPGMAAGLKTGGRVPKARKSGLPAGCLGIKTINLLPVSNVIINLGSPSSSSSSSGHASTGAQSQEEEGLSQPAESPVDMEGHPGKGRARHARKRRRMGTYNFPDSKKKKKKFLHSSTSSSQSTDPSKAGTRMQQQRSPAKAGMGRFGVRSPLRSPMRSPMRGPVGSPVRPAPRPSERGSLMELLTRNAQAAFRSPLPRRRLGSRPRRLGPETHHGKTVLDLWRQRSQNKAAAASAAASAAVTAAGEAGKGSVTKAAGEAPTEQMEVHSAEAAPPEMVSQSDPAEVSQESGVRKSLRKRKAPEGSEVEDSHSSLDSDSNSCGSAAKRPRCSEEEEEDSKVKGATSAPQATPPTLLVAGVTVAVSSGGQAGPVVTIVSEHSPAQLGLRSLLTPQGQAPPPPTATPRTTVPSAFTVAVARPASTITCTTTSTGSDALRALLTAPSSARPPSAPCPASQGSNTSTSSSTSSLSSLSSLACNGEVKGKEGRTPNGLALYPVTPPHTPDEACNGEAGQASLPSGTESTRSEVPVLCSCRMNGASLSRLVSSGTFCQALDSVDNKVLGCCEKVTSNTMVRPAVTIPFIAVCESHRGRLKQHQCCPGCGHFCVQGTFFQCRKGTEHVPHLFHEQCVIVRGGQQLCPHCGRDSEQFQVQLRMDEPRRLSGVDNLRPKHTSSRARMAVTKSLTRSKDSDSEAPPVKFVLSTVANKILSSDGLPVSTSRTELERVLGCLTQERPKKYRTLPKSLYAPAAEGDLEKTVYMLVDGADPNTVCEEDEDRTPLHVAVLSGNLALVQVLVQAGAEVHKRDRTLKTALMLAAEADQVPIMQFLIKAGANILEKGEDGMTCLHMAAKLGHLASVRYLVEKERMDTNIQDDGGWTPMIWAVESQFLDTVRYLIQSGADPEIMDDEENTGLHWAAFAGSVEIAQMFLDRGCTLDRPNEHGDRPIHIAARRDHYGVVVLLLSRGAVVEVQNSRGETPITACVDKHSQTCLALKVHTQLRAFSAKRLPRPERLLSRDVSMGREKNPIACVNAEDDEACPTDFLYVAANVITSHIPVNRVITSLQSCRCRDNCSSLTCVCSRSSVKCWYDNMGRMVNFNPLDPPLVFECNTACRCWTNCNNRVVQNGITCRLELFRTVGRGWGVKTLTDIPQGTFVCEYIGELISDQEADRCEDDSYLFDLDNKEGETYCIDARKYGNISRFVNHLCDPNLVTVKVFTEHQDLRFPHICFFASRDIKAHEELGFDYGEKFWVIKWKQFTCACGSPKCKYSKDMIHKTLEDYYARHEEENPVPET